jgi:hypothetical protein
MYCSPILTGASSYEIQDFKVFFGNQYLPDARWSDFKDLGQGYGLSSSLKLFNFSNFSLLGRDGNHVFFMGQIVKNAHPFSFEVIGNTYAKDYQHVFQYGQIIENPQPQFFQPSSINESMIRQPINSIYPMQMSIPVSDVSSTAIPSYKIQDFKVFFGNEYVSDARWIDFTNLGQGYGICFYL